jgi:hypothetical protein
VGPVVSRLALAESGEELVILWRPLVRLVAVESSRPLTEAYGALRGEIELAPGFDELPSENALGTPPVPDDLPERLAGFAFERLPVTEVHPWAVRRLSPAHHDPFDRLPAAQALCDRAAIVSADAICDAYGVTRIW